MENINSTDIKITENVAFLSFDSNENGGGVQRVSCLLATGFRKKGIKPYLIYNNMSSTPSTFYESKLCYNGSADNNELESFIKDNRIGFVINNCVVSSVYTGAEIKTVLERCNCKLIAIIHAKPDLIKVTPSRYSLAWVMRRSKSIFTKISFLIKILFFPIYKNISNRKYIKWRKGIYNNSDRVVVLSRYYIDNLCNMLNADKTKVVSIPNPLNFEYTCSETDIDNKRNEVLIVSRLEESSKGLSRVFKAWRIIEMSNQNLNWQLTVVGSGVDKNYYQDLCSKYNLKNVIFEGHQKPFEYYKRAKIFVMASFHEGLPMTVLEAEQMGLAIVAINNFESLGDLVKDGVNGFLVNDNIDLFAKKIQELIQSPSLCKKCAMASVEHSKRFLPQEIVDMWFKLFKDVKNG